MLKHFFFFLFFSHLFLACKSTTPAKLNVDSAAIVTAATSPIPQVEKLAASEQLTFTGDNRFASISDDNTKILFASRLRTQHRDFQIYELSLTQGKEERLSFNDGLSIDPIYSDDNTQIYFASSTDEMKEFQIKLDLSNQFPLPFSIYNSTNSTVNLEIYSLSITNNKNIPKRITEHSGYDANPQPITKTDFSWVQKNKKDFKIFKWNTKDKAAVEIFKQSDPIWKASWNNSILQWAWISWNADNPNPTTKIFTLKEKSVKPEALPLPEGIYHDVSWLPNENSLIFSLQLKNAVDFDIYIFDLKTQCLRPLILNPGDDIEPTINKKNSFLVFAHRPPGNKANQFQLYKKNLNSAQEPCIKTTL